MKRGIRYTRQRPSDPCLIVLNLTSIRLSIESFYSFLHSPGCLTNFPTVATLSKRSSTSLPNSNSPFKSRIVAFPLAASVSVLLWTNPVNAGILSGFSGLESVPGPQLPRIDFLNKWNEVNQKKYEELDSQFKSSKVLKELLEKTKQNKEKNQQLIQDKYCLRGAKWGIGDCSTQGMTEQERNDFVTMLNLFTHFYIHQGV